MISRETKTTPVIALAAGAVRAERSDARTAGPRAGSDPVQPTVSQVRALAQPVTRPGPAAQPSTLCHSGGA